MRLIDANALPVATLINGGHWTKSVVYKSDVDAAPTVDAVEVVRCARCVYSRELNRKRQKEKEFTKKCIWCSYYDTGKLPDDYCSDGERKE